ncbi:unnamed protein product, partial [Rotaria socialis]
PDNNMNSITIMSKNEHEHEQNERNTTTRLPSPIRESISNYVKHRCHNTFTLGIESFTSQYPTQQ